MSRCPLPHQSCRLYHGAGVGAVQRHHGVGAAGTAACVGVSAGTGGAALQPRPPRALPASGGPKIRRVHERGGYGGGEPELRRGAVERSTRPRAAVATQSNAEAALTVQAIAAGDVCSCASFASPTWSAPSRNNHEPCPSTSIVDLTSTSDV